MLTYFFFILKFSFSAKKKICKKLKYCIISLVLGEAMSNRNNGEKRHAFIECSQFIYESQIESMDMSHKVIY